MNLRQITYSITGIQFPTSEPLSFYKYKSSDILEQEIAKRQELFDTMVINNNIFDIKDRILVPNVVAKVANIANRMIANRARYKAVANMFACPIKWYHVALIHQMEGGGDFNTYLGNGQRLSHKTTIVPIGRGPFKSFESGAIDAIKQKGLNYVQDWSIGNALYILEGFNGYGYSDFKGINSPYLWSGSNQYRSGYYIADHVYSSTTVSQQIGIALILKQLISLGVT